MAIVQNLAFPTGTSASASFPVDPPLCTPNRYIAAKPNNTYPPLYPGEIVVDTTSQLVYKAIGAVAPYWVPWTYGPDE